MPPGRNTRASSLAAMGSSSSVEVDPGEQHDRRGQRRRRQREGGQRACRGRHAVAVPSDARPSSGRDPRRPSAGRARGGGGRRGRARHRGRRRCQASRRARPAPGGRRAALAPGDGGRAPGRRRRRSARPPCRTSAGPHCPRRGPYAARRHADRTVSRQHVRWRRAVRRGGRRPLPTVTCGVVPAPVVGAGPARRLRDAIEPIAMHAVWARRTNERLAGLGLDFLGGYVWGRAAALGEPDAGRRRRVVRRVRAGDAHRDLRAGASACARETRCSRRGRRRPWRASRRCSPARTSGPSPTARVTALDDGRRRRSSAVRRARPPAVAGGSVRAAVAGVRSAARAPRRRPHRSQPSRPGSIRSR